MKIAMLSPIAWSTPPQHYGPWEYVVSLLTEELVKQDVEVTLFATGNSRTSARLVSVCPRGYEEDPSINPKVWESLHISELFEQGDSFDLIHNHFDFLPLTYSAITSTPVLTTIHGFSSPDILPVYQKYNRQCWYVSISNSDRHPKLGYAETVYHGIDLDKFTFQPAEGTYLLFFGRIHPEKGTRTCIDIAKQAHMKLIIAGIIQDRDYYKRCVEPQIDGEQIVYVGSVGPHERNKLLGGAYALLHPISFDEPFGLSVVEAMACGTPVIAVNRGSMSEIIIDNVTGSLVEDAQEIPRILPKLSTLSRGACRKHVEKYFSVQRMTQDYIRVYLQILDEASQQGHS